METKESYRSSPTNHSIIINKNCKILLTNLKKFAETQSKDIENYDFENYKICPCPECGHINSIKNGTYYKWIDYYIPQGNNYILKSNKIAIQKYICKDCNLPYTGYPDFVMPKVSLSTSSILLLIFLREETTTKIKKLKINATRVWFTMKKFLSFYSIIKKEILEEIKKSSSIGLCYVSSLCLNKKSQIFQKPPSTRSEGNST